jgi:hypothetical protein
LQDVYGQAEILEGEQVKRTAALRVDDSVANNLVGMMRSRNDPGVAILTFFEVWTLYKNHERRSGTQQGTFS